MSKSKRMRVLGRRGGRAGGPARARALSPRRRAEIAQRAARARWGRSTAVVATPRSHEQLLDFVAHHGSVVAASEVVGDLEAIAVRAIKASRRDSAMARMLPVFLWRLRQHLDPAKLVKEARRQGLGPALGFFLEVASVLGEGSPFEEALTQLRRSLPPRPAYFFEGTSLRPFERAATDLNTPVEARRWGLLMNMPFDSFASYFRKVAAL